MTKMIWRIWRRPTTTPRHLRDRREARDLPTHPWFQQREQRALELGQYR
jgi:hypothetical protein